MKTKRQHFAEMVEKSKQRRRRAALALRQRQLSVAREAARPRTPRGCITPHVL